MSVAAAPSSLKFDCPSCHKTLVAPLAAAGVTAPCPHCHQKVTAPPAPDTVVVQPQEVAPPSPTSSSPASLNLPPSNPALVPSPAVAPGPLPSVEVSDVPASAAPPTAPSPRPMLQPRPAAKSSPNQGKKGKPGKPEPHRLPKPPEPPQHDQPTVAPLPEASVATPPRKSTHPTRTTSTFCPGYKPFRGSAPDHYPRPASTGIQGHKHR
jgi:hypothetical protein